jgi:autoinducer 2-degrading protein
MYNPRSEDISMYVASVTIFVKSESIQSFIDATFDNAQNTRKEPGNVRFDVLQAEEDPSQFLLYEAYHRKEDFAAHQQTAHYSRWKQAVTDLMAQPRQGVKHHALFFGDAKV